MKGYFAFLRQNGGPIKMYYRGTQKDTRDLIELFKNLLTLSIKRSPDQGKGLIQGIIYMGIT